MTDILEDIFDPRDEINIVKTILIGLEDLDKKFNEIQEQIKKGGVIYTLIL
ncbi:hypothetical protein IT084_15480 [Desulfallas sp. Bu1-1]|uniref:hypothetical protein n=1 Tax=Desulfallas sp. Bu1-1 TaxID=2787620 RepID=UPI00189F84C3|nr:hypothetical protein [Desulfallas sp. Bu1-1]MBF7084355.1 hypothetical protein [Desulfallas sp. Bu1-1]